MSKKKGRFLQLYGKEFVKKEECWKSGLEMVKSCSLVENASPILIKPEIFSLIYYLVREIDTEWILFLKENEGIIVDFWMPKQEVTSGSADPSETPLEGNWGVVHSHNSMGSFFSHTDEKYLKDFIFSIVVSVSSSNGFEYKATRRSPTVCNKVCQAEVEILPYFSKGEIEKITSKLQEKKFGYEDYWKKNKDGDKEFNMQEYYENLDGQINY